jgi:hypothetical protein
MMDILKWWSDNPVLGCILLFAAVVGLEAIFTPLGNWFRPQRFKEPKP